MEYAYKLERKKLDKNMKAFHAALKQHRKEFAAGHKERKALLNTAEKIIDAIRITTDPHLVEQLGKVHENIMQAYTQSTARTVHFISGNRGELPYGEPMALPTPK